VNYAITNRAYLFSISLALIVLMALACTATPATPAPTPDVPLLDEQTVVHLTIGFLYETSGDKGKDDRNHQCFLWQAPTNAQYIGKDIWVVVMESMATFCTFAFHDKEARVIVPQQGKTTD